METETLSLEKLNNMMGGHLNMSRAKEAPRAAIVRLIDELEQNHHPVNAPMKEFSWRLYKD